MIALWKGIDHKRLSLHFLPGSRVLFFSQTPHGYMATTKRIWKKVYSICNLCNQFHWKHIMAIYLQMLRYYLEYWCRRYKDTHKVIFTKTIINKYVFFGTAVLAAIFYVHSVQPFSVMYVYIYIYGYVNTNLYIYVNLSEFNSISSCAILFLDLMWCFCVCILHIYIYICNQQRWLPNI